MTRDRGYTILQKCPEIIFKRYSYVGHERAAGSMSEFSFRKWMASFPIRKWSRYEIPVVTSRFLETVTRSLILWILLPRFLFFILYFFLFVFLEDVEMYDRIHGVGTNIDRTNRRETCEVLQEEQYIFQRYINLLIFACSVIFHELGRCRNRKGISKEKNLYLSCDILEWNFHHSALGVILKRCLTNFGKDLREI